ncbi:TlpA family protein disulfide reductase [Ideonella sp. 4Y16]|uniref:TlpA family protein disulfide reductase n=1 Tax=Ideonella alba TaxID=2824118 RepID=UPI001B374CEF|nr:TlpA disulfide reductase family protein [Ideonella alba]MBQ0945303.1 TlpA family protein disulfide reductase [Ideonella alba]
MSRNKAIAPLLLVAVVVALLAAMAGASLWATRPSARQQPASAPPMATTQPGAVWSLTLPDARGRQQALQAWRGKVLVLNFWATWCPPCREEMPVFSRAQTTFGPQGVQMVGLSIDTPDNVARFEAEHPLSYPLLMGGVDLLELSVAWGNSAQAMPFTAFFGRDGRLAAVHLGPLSEPALEQQLRTLLAAQP